MGHHYLENRDIVLFSYQPWDNAVGFNFKDLALEFAKKNRVLFVNRALDYLTAFLKRDDPSVQSRLLAVKSGQNELIEVSPNLFVYNPRVILKSINSIPVSTIHDYFSNQNIKNLSVELRKMIQNLGMNRIILINDNDFIRGLYLPKYLDYDAYIYYLRDYMLGIKSHLRHGPRHEHALMTKVNLVTANSVTLADYAKEFNPNSFNVGQGCELSLFSKDSFALPPEMASIHGPKIGYVGALSQSNLDYLLLEKLAREIHEAQLVFVGSADETFAHSVLKQMPNVHFLGLKRPEELPAYIHGFDVCIHPQKISELTTGNFPRKIIEYLAAGKPTIAIKTQTMEECGQYLLLSETADEFVNMVRYSLNNLQSLHEPSKILGRKKYAFSNTWDKSAGLIGDAYHQVMEEDKSFSL
jgi:teichuronic acid biosynthesis glycosyltransferase TuaH